MAEVGRWLEEGPDPGAPSWTVALAGKRIKEVFEVAMSLEGGSPLDAGAGLPEAVAAPVHPKADPRKEEEFRSDFKGKAEAVLPEGADLEGVDVRFRDKARIGRKGMPARVWAKRGDRPRVPRDHRRGYCYLFSGIRPEDGAGRHGSKALEITSSVSPPGLLPCSPELNPTETSSSS